MEHSEQSYTVMLAMVEDFQRRNPDGRTIPPNICNVDDLAELLRAHIELTTDLVAKTEAEERQDYQDEMDRSTAETNLDNRYAGAPY